MAGDGVEVVPRALGDARFVRLAELCKLADEDHALGKMVRLWAACRALESHVLPDGSVLAVLGAGGVDHLVEARLGERLLSGGTRIKGAAELIRWRARKSAPGSSESPAADRRTRTWTDDERAVAARVLGKLSDRTGYRYKVDAAYHVQPIVRLLREGATERDLQRVVWHRCLEWKDNTTMETFLRPKTLFAPTNFAAYLPQADAEVERLQREQADRARPTEATPFLKGDG